MQPASCAVCGGAITKGGGFVLVGCEVVHKSQFCLSRAGETKNAKLAAKLAETKRELEYTEEDLGAIRQQLQRAARAGEEAMAAINRVRHDEAQRERDLFDYKRRLNVTTIERDNAIEERDAARREAALHQMLAREPHAPAATSTTPPPAPAPEPQTDEKDASEIRFSLLELQ